MFHFKLSEIWHLSVHHSVLIPLIDRWPPSIQQCVRMSMQQKDVPHGRTSHTMGTYVCPFHTSGHIDSDCLIKVSNVQIWTGGVGAAVDTHTHTHTHSLTHTSCRCDSVCLFIWKGIQLFDKVVLRSCRCKYDMNIDVLLAWLPLGDFMAAGALRARGRVQPLFIHAMQQNVWWAHPFFFVQYEQNIVMHVIYPLSFLVMPGPDVNRILIFVCIKAHTPILKHEWSCLRWAGKMHSCS